MDISKIIGLVVCVIAVCALIVLLFIICVPLAKTENDERQKKTKMYEKITEYLDVKIVKDKQFAEGKSDFLKKQAELMESKSNYLKSKTKVKKNEKK